MSHKIKLPKVKRFDPDRWDNFFLEIIGAKAKPKHKNMFANKNEYEKSKQQ